MKSHVFGLDLCLPLMLMYDGAIAMVTDSEQRLSVRLCAETISITVIQHTPFLNAVYVELMALPLVIYPLYLSPECCLL